VTEHIMRNVTRMGQMSLWVRQHVCRHEYLKHTEGNRVFLKCEYCQRETPGWDLSGIRPRQVFEGDPERFKCEHVAGPEKPVVKAVRKQRKAKLAKESELAL
jgi:hypothetical protein